MITIVITYYNRQNQLNKTLESFRNYKDINIIIVDDNSPEDIKLSTYPFDIQILKLCTKSWICPAPVFNIGFAEALKNNPEVVIIQNAECYHVGNIVNYVRNNLTDKNYLSFAAYSLSKDQDINLKRLTPRGATGNGDSAWYNHSKYRPEALHFCCAITPNNLRKLNGFDERFMYGLGYEDDYFIHQVRTLGLKVEIVDNPFVFHQYHYDVKSFTFNAEQYSENGALCKMLKRENNYRAVHLITSDL